MTAADIIAAHQYVPAFYQCHCLLNDDNAETMTRREHAEHVLAVLKAAGFEVVQLPKPEQDLWDESDAALWQSESCAPIRLHWSGQVVYGSDWLNPSEARSDAAALLAAANAAEEAK